VDLGLVGLPNAGKTALFNLITGAAAEVAPYPFTTREPLRGTADVPDPRLGAIADVQDIPRRVPAQVQVVDIAGLQSGAGRGEGLGGQALGRLREMDAVVHVVRSFANAEVPHPGGRIDPLADAEAVDLELVLADREQVTRRAERVERAARSGDAAARAEAEPLAALLTELGAGRPARRAPKSALDVAAGLGLLTAKPTLLLANVDEPGPPPDTLAAYAEEQGALAMALPVGIELELAALPEDEAGELAAELGLGEARGAAALVAAGYGLLDLVTFFTGSGPPEARAWPVPRGTTADRAAGRIHSDMERGFIRAEVVPWDALVEAGSFARARERALVRIEGREYVVQEGDVLQVRFNV
jgi:GTP-binding protein YchF